MRFAQLLMERVRIELENRDCPAAVRRELRTQWKIFCAAFGGLGQQLTPIWLLMTASERRQLELAIAALMSSSLAIGEYVQVSPDRIKLDAHNQAKAARKARAQAPKEIALIKAIVAARGTGPVRQPSKEAGIIELEVNKQLVTAGHRRVKVDVIYRRLKKFDASTRSKIPRS
jgi:hypothetical protein